MKTVTRNLLKFVLVGIFLTIVFRFCLSYGISTNSNPLIFASSIFYGLAMFISGGFYGRKEREYLPIHDIGFRFHLSTYLVHNLISELWFFLRLNSKFENISAVHSTAVIWGIFLVIHLGFYLWTRKDTINDLDKSNLFD